MTNYHKFEEEKKIKYKSWQQRALKNINILQQSVQNNKHIYQND